VGSFNLEYFLGSSLVAHAAGSIRNQPEKSIKPLRQPIGGKDFQLSGF
jgi:hypothetical protein